MVLATAPVSIPRNRAWPLPLNMRIKFFSLIRSTHYLMWVAIAQSRGCAGGSGKADHFCCIPSMGTEVLNGVLLFFQQSHTVYLNHGENSVHNGRIDVGGSSCSRTGLSRHRGKKKGTKERRPASSCPESSHCSVLHSGIILGKVGSVGRRRDGSG